MSAGTYSDYMASHRTKAKPRYEGYTGNKIWRVRHPDHGEIEVLAPSKQAAIVVAASTWDRRWQKYDFYAWCEVSYCGTEKKQEKER